MTAARTAFPIPSTNPAILIATPNTGLRKRLTETLRKVTTVDEASGGAEALSKLERQGSRIVVLDRKLPDLNCDELISVLELQFPGTDVVLLDGDNGELDIPEELRSSAAYQWFEVLSGSELPEAKTEEAPEQPASPMSLPGIVGESPALQQVASLVRSVARHDISVLVTGETGTGKELIAAAVHALSDRADKPFVTVNCAALPEALVESELFGHARGAFTGAVQSRLGKVHAAQGGTLFLDEIGELPLASQAKLLRFLECGEVQRLGTTDVFRLDTRVIAATNAELERKVEQGLFRADLFYRLSVFPIELPPLRDRGDDLLLLATHFLTTLANGRTPSFSDDAKEKLRGHSWPGNVRELRHVVERAIVLANGDDVITAKHILLTRIRPAN